MVEFQDVVKKYHRHIVASLKYTILQLPRVIREWRGSGFTALDRVSFSVQRGEMFGICGRNGSGKSTTLGLMAGVLRSTSGTVRVQGRISPLLELGAGFHSELSGRDNIWMNATILGLRRREIRARFEEIVEFAGLKDFVDEPMRTYSSGMSMRLGFSVAVHTDPELLLVDEVLAVGDLEFQRKCLDKMEQFRRAGVTIVFVSHDLPTVKKMCDRAMLLEHGQVVVVDTPNEVERRYSALIAMA